jgi:hypothetical protein
LSLQTKKRRFSLREKTLLSRERKTTVGSIVMALIARILGVSLLVAALGAGLGFALFAPNPDYPGICFILACVGAIIGAVAGTARETVTASQERPLK